MDRRRSRGSHGVMHNSSATPATARAARLQRAATACVLLVGLLLCGCDGGSSGDGGVGDSGVDGNVDVDGDAGTLDGGSDLVVSGTSPDEGATDVALNPTIIVSFDRELAPESIGEGSLIVLGAGEEVIGQLTATATTIVLAVPRLAPNTEYTATVSASVRGADEAALAADHVFSFRTGETYADGTRPRGADYLPLGCTFGFAPKVEYMLIGLDDVSNVQLRDPLEFNSPEPPADPSADLVYGESNAALVTTMAKRAATGALDRDYQDEVVAVSWAPTGVGTLSVLDHGDEGPSSTTLALDLTIDDRAGGAYQYDVALGDVDGDCLDEILVVGVIEGATAAERLGRLWVFDDAPGSHALLHTLDLVGEFDPSTGNLGVDRVAVAAGRVDEDLSEEIVIAYALAGQPALSVLVLDDAAAAYAGDGADELFVFGLGYTYQHYLEPPTLALLEDTDLCENDAPPLGTSRFFTGQSMTVGDVNGDRRDDLIIYDGEVRVVGCVAHPHYNPDTGELESITNHTEEIDRRGSFSSSTDFALVMAPNVDQDSIVLGLGAVVPNPDAPLPGPGEPQPTRFEEHTVYFADNRLIAVVAAPPCAEGIGQNTDSCSAGFGTSTGGSISAGVTVAVRAGILVGMEAEVQGGFLFASATLASVEAEISAELEVAGHVTATTATSQTITNTTGSDQDLVIFAATPYDRYVYGIRSHPDGDLIGEPVTIDVPQPARIFAVSRQYYNATNGDQMDIGSVFLPNRPGDLASYPRRAEIDALLASPNAPLGRLGPVTVNEGSGSQSLEQELTSELTGGASVTMSVDSMAKVCGATFETSIEMGTVFMSEVGAIDAANFAEQRYEYGLFAYKTNVRDPNGAVLQSFVVVNHWVE